MKELQSFISKFSIPYVDFDGCSLGLKTPKGEFIKKPLRIITTSNRLIHNLKDRKCSGDHAHQRCEGSSSKMSAFYTIEMADLIIDGLCAPEPPLKNRKQKEPLRQQKDPAAQSTRLAVRPEEDFGHDESAPGIAAERVLPPAWAGRVDIKMLTATPSVVDTLSRQLDKVINKAKAKLEKLQASTEASQQCIDKSKQFLRERNKHFIQDSEVERELVLKQLHDLELQNKHREKIAFNPVSYTHLTLPTNREV